MFKLLIVGCLTVLVALGASAFEEHPHFCIETEPLLLSEIDRRIVMPSEKDQQCHIKATTLTLKEKVNPQIGFNNALSILYLKSILK